MVKTSTQIGDLQGIIRDIQAGFSSWYALVLTPHDVSISQFAVLLCLSQEQPRKMSEVAKALHVSLPAVTHLADRLGAKGMITRKPHPTDRRVNLLEMSVKGKALVDKTQGRTLKIMTNAVEDQTSEGRDTILKFMKAMRTGLRQAIDDASS